MRSGICPTMPALLTSSSRSSAAAMRGGASSSPPTCPSVTGRPSFPTRPPPPRSSIGSSTTPRSSPSRGRAIGAAWQPRSKSHHVAAHLPDRPRPVQNSAVFHVRQQSEDNVTPILLAYLQRLRIDKKPCAALERRRAEEAGDLNGGERPRRLPVIRKRRSGAVFRRKPATSSSILETITGSSHRKTARQELRRARLIDHAVGEMPADRHRCPASGRQREDSLKPCLAPYLSQGFDSGLTNCFFALFIVEIVVLQLGHRLLQPLSGEQPSVPN